MKNLAQVVFVTLIILHFALPKPVKYVIDSLVGLCFVAYAISFLHGGYNKWGEYVTMATIIVIITALSGLILVATDFYLFVDSSPAPFTYFVDLVSAVFLFLGLVVLHVFRKSVSVHP